MEFNYDDDSVIQDSISDPPHEEPHDPTQEIWYHQEENPELDHHDYGENEFRQEEIDPFLQINEIKQLSVKKSKLKSNPEFQATVYRYVSEQNLALHDHERQDIIESTHRFNESCFVYRYKVGNDILIDFLNEEQAKMGFLPHQNAEVLFQIKFEKSLIDKGKNFFRIIPQKISQSEEKSLKNKRLDKRIYKNIKQKGKYPDLFTFHRLKKDDEIRFGLQTFRVVEIQLCMSSQRQEKKTNQKLNSEKESDKMIPKQKKIEQGTCKICLCNENTTEDPLMNPCNCIGTCQYVHFNCLKTWIDSNMEKQTQILVDSYKWTKFECEICKIPYPLKLMYQGQVLRLAEFIVPDVPYVVFERIRSGCRKQILVVKGKENPVHIGRNVDCDFKIVMNTVSRIHAIIEFNEGQFYLKDLASKYGTLVRINEPMRIEGKLKIQVGDVLMRFNLVMKKEGAQYVWKYN